MKIVIDTHCHTLQSKHSTATLTENIKRAKELGLMGLCVTNHGPIYGDSPGEAYFGGLKRLPFKDGDFYVFSGAEVNIKNNQGEVDLSDEILSSLRWVIASIHSVCFFNNDKEYITNAYINVLKNPFVHCLGHIGQEKFPCDFEKVVETAKKYNKVIEINNSSLTGMRKGAPELCCEVARLCKKYEVFVVVSSDAHDVADIGNFKEAEKLLRETEFPDELILNLDSDRFISYIKRK